MQKVVPPCRIFFAFDGLVRTSVVTLFAMFEGEFFIDHLNHIERPHCEPLRLAHGGKERDG